MNKWTRTRPTEDGWYWFCGQINPGGPEGMWPLVCHAAGSERILVCEGQFVYRDAVGMFMPLEVPDPPTGDTLTIEPSTN